jgi:ligand-binding SRPBCC domain-containing protein
MADHVLESRLWLPRSREEVFEFFTRPENLGRVTPPALGFRLLTPTPVGLATGTVLDYRIRWLGVPLRWRTFIREYDPPFRFVDVQVRGPYARWEHRHLFLDEDGGTVVEDRVTYRLPLGPLGALAHATLVRRQLAGIWAYREARLAEYLGPLRRRGG